MLCKTQPLLVLFYYGKNTLNAIRWHKQCTRTSPVCADNVQKMHASKQITRV